MLLYTRNISGKGLLMSDRTTKSKPLHLKNQKVVNKFIKAGGCKDTKDDFFRVLNKAAGEEK